MSNLKDWTLSTVYVQGGRISATWNQGFPPKIWIFGGTKVVRTVLRKGGGQTSSAGVSWLQSPFFQAQVGGGSSELENIETRMLIVLKAELNSVNSIWGGGCGVVITEAGCMW